jgi:hypothetical protein
LEQRHARLFLDSILQARITEPVDMSASGIEKTIQMIIQAETVGHADPQQPVRLQHSRKFGQCAVEFCHVLQRMVADGEVDRPGRQRQSMRVGADEADAAAV